MADDRSIATRLQESIDGSESIEVLIRWLLAELAAMGVTATPRPELLAGQECQETVLDVEVDGDRWCLVRHVVEPAEDAVPALSPREQEIARMVAKGYANKSIASVLDISSWTVSSHLRRIYAKLGVNTRAAMVACLLESGRSGAYSFTSSHRRHPRLPASPLHGQPN
jgi:DNA-binding CsgD family transcriptional regulator